MSEEEYTDPTAWANPFTYEQNGEQRVAFGITVVGEDGENENIGAVFGVEHMDPDGTGIPVRGRETNEEGERETNAFLNPRGDEGQVVQLNLLGEEENEDLGIVASSLLEQRREEILEGEDVTGVPFKRQVEN